MFFFPSFFWDDSSYPEGSLKVWVAHLQTNNHQPDHHLYAQPWAAQLKDTPPLQGLATYLLCFWTDP